jgi:ornithine carbamoyltransferase
MDKPRATAFQDKSKSWICTQELMDLTNKGKYMHCGPADRGQEVTDDVIDNKNYSLYFEEAENRLHVQKAVMALVMGDRASRRRK